MGCISSIAAPDLLKLNSEGYECLSEIVSKYNKFYQECEHHMQDLMYEERKIDQHFNELLQESRSSGTLEYNLAESYIYIILFLIHRSQLNEPAYSFKFSNYIPGILANQDLLSGPLKDKYNNLIALCELLPSVLEKLNDLGEAIIEDIVIARNEIPSTMLKIAKENSEINIIDFGKIEKD